MCEVKDHFVQDLMDQYSGSLVRFLSSRVASEDDAADIAQEAFIRLYKLQDPQKLENARAYLYQVASNIAIDNQRRATLHSRWIRQEVSQQLDDSHASRLEAENPESQLQNLQHLERVYRIVDGLPEKCRKVFLMHRTQNLTYSQIATEMELSVSSVEKYILQALRHCRTALD